MLTFTHKCGQGQIELVDDGSARVYVTGDDSLLHLLQLEFSKGISHLTNFKQKGISRKIKTFRKIVGNEDIVYLLKSVQEKYPHFEIIMEDKERS
ncbi:hypothetical protein [Anoxybacillus kestanbolensis]|uniref:hypothetical protein n=1 Tax=Anoxybacillus kestanbolensis TaxID=227476 RepID=UPI003D1E6E7D